jgi:hypothetical protein
MRFRLTQLLCCTVLAGCADGAVDSEVRTIVIGELLREKIASLADTSPPYFSFALGMSIWKDSIAVADVRADAIHVLPLSLEGGRSFGRDGEGPGELGRVFALEAQHDTLFVYDRENARVSKFIDEGVFVGQQPLTIGTSRATFVVDSESVLSYPATDSEYFVERVSGAGVELLVPRPPEQPPHQRGRFEAVENHSSGLVVVDTNNLRVLFAGRDDARWLAPPEALEQSLKARVRELEASDPSLIGFPVLATGPTSEGVLLWFPVETGTVASVVTPEGEWIEMIAEQPVAEMAYPMDLLVHEGRLYLLFVDGIRVFALSDA